MAAVDFEFFFSTFVPSFLEGLEGLEVAEKMMLVSKLKNEQVGWWGGGLMEVEW